MQTELEMMTSKDWDNHQNQEGGMKDSFSGSKVNQTADILACISRWKKKLEKNVFLVF